MSMHRPYWMMGDPTNGYGSAQTWPTPPPSTRLASSASPPSSYTSSSTSASASAASASLASGPGSSNGSGPGGVPQLPPTPPKDPNLHQHDHHSHKHEYHDPYHPASAASGPASGTSTSYQPQDHLEPESKETVQLLSKPQTNDSGGLESDPSHSTAPHPSSSPSAATPSMLNAYDQDYSGANPGSNNPEAPRGFKSEITSPHEAGASVTPDNNSSYSNYSSLSHPHLMSPGDPSGTSSAGDPYSSYGSASSSYMPNSQASTSSNARLSTNSSTTSNSTSAKSSKGKNRPNAGTFGQSFSRSYYIQLIFNPKTFHKRLYK